MNWPFSHLYQVLFYWLKLTHLVYHLIKLFCSSTFAFWFNTNCPSLHLVLPRLSAPLPSELCSYRVLYIILILGTTRFSQLKVLVLLLLWCLICSRPFYLSLLCKIPQGGFLVFLLSGSCYLATSSKDNVWIHRESVQSWLSRLPLPIQSWLPSPCCGFFESRSPAVPAWIEVLGPPRPTLGHASVLPMCSGWRTGPGSLLACQWKEPVLR